MVQNKLQDQLQDIPGVASAEVTLRDDAAPVARVFLDGSREPDEVRDRVNALLGAQLPSQPSQAAPQVKKRSGLGKGLEDLLHADSDEPAPAHINGKLPRPVVAGIARVGVVEAQSGVVVEVEDTLGNLSSVNVGNDGSIDSAVIDGIRDLCGVHESTYISIRDVDTGQGSVVVAAATSGDGQRMAGAAFVEFGRPFATATAVMRALSDG